MRRFLVWLVVLLLFSTTSFARADSFGSGVNSFEIEFVHIDSPGNPGDPTGSPFNGGAVDYNYRIGTYEVSEQMIDKANALGGLGITKDTRGPDKPATSISWFEAAKFVNWLNETTGNIPAYKFDVAGNFQLWDPSDPGYNAANRYRNAQAKYILPSENEWYKAAYYDPVLDVYYDYPTGSDAVPDGIDFPGDAIFDAVFFDGPGNPGPGNTNPGPNDIFNVGLLGPYGTAGQGGNVTEWVESAFDLENNSPAEHRGSRGGNWASIITHLDAANAGIGIGPAFEADFFGFRVVQIPEPSSLVLMKMSILALVIQRRRKWTFYLNWKSKKVPFLCL